MGQHQPHQITALFNQKADVRHEDFDAGQVVARKGDAEVDRKPSLLARRAEAINRQIHADLARPAKRRKDQFFRRGCHLRN